MSDKTVKERLAVLETIVAGHVAEQHKHNEHIAEVQEQILARLARYDTRWGMATMVVAGITGALWYFKELIMIKVKQIFGIEG